jgi:hypothetical protein
MAVAVGEVGAAPFKKNINPQKMVSKIKKKMSNKKFWEFF